MSDIAGAPKLRGMNVSSKSVLQQCARKYREGLFRGFMHFFSNMPNATEI